MVVESVREYSLFFLQLHIFVLYKCPIYRMLCPIHLGLQPFGRLLFFQKSCLFGTNVIVNKQL